MVNAHYFYFKDDGRIPNNTTLSVIYYPAVFKANPEKIEQVFNEHGWRNSWTGGVFNYHHYHSNTHEVLGVRSGSAVLRIGGDHGENFRVSTGDVVLLPAGTGHKLLESSQDFQVIGAYPEGKSYNLKTGKVEERPFVLDDIQNTPVPKTDPVFGSSGPVTKHWS
ncbi:MAG: cupin domain-containing protein [Planococcus donghaensis]|nr:cupin domain-containing protein [Planococcus donghaensis]